MQRGGPSICRQTNNSYREVLLVFFPAPNHTGPTKRSDVVGLPLKLLTVSNNQPNIYLLTFYITFNVYPSINNSLIASRVVYVCM